MHIAVLLDHSQAVRSLRSAFRLGPGGPARAHLRSLSTWTELYDLLASDECDLALVQPCHGYPPTSPDPSLAGLETLATRWPREQVVLFVVRPRPGPHLLRDIGQMGFPYLLVQGIDDDPRTILRTVARAESRRLLRRRLESKRAGLDPEVAGLVLDSLTAWPPALSVQDLALQSGMGRRNLQRVLRQAGLPSPGKLVALSRFLEACVIGQRMGVSSRARIASIPDSGDAASLGHLSRRVANRPLGEFIGSDATEDPFSFVADTLRA